MQLFQHFSANGIRLDPLPFKSELPMAAYLVENEGVLALDQDTLSEVEIITSELSVKHGRASRKTDGRIDILAKYSEEFFAIIEVKHGTLCEAHLEQLEDYLNKRDQVLDREPESYSKDATTKPRWLGVLVGTAIQPALAQKLAGGYRAHTTIPIAALTIQRYRGPDKQIYVLTDTVFSGLTLGKDTTKYKFAERTYGKGRLVLEVIKHHVRENPHIRFPELLLDFPDDCQGRRGVFASETDARELYERTGHTRHFLAPEDIITLTDGSRYAVSNQWGIGNIGRFLERAKKLHYSIRPINK